MLCAIAYFAVYVARNLLGVVSPGMIETGCYTEVYIGTISTGYLLAYACGQLIYGAIGDKIISRYMISGGLLGAGLCNIALPFAPDLLTTTILYSVSDFFLSMIYGPMTKTVSENVKPIYAARVALGYTVASFLGSPAAGAVAIFSGVTLAMSVGPFLNTLLVYERLFKRNRGKTVLCMFSVSAAAFLAMFFCKQPVIGVILLTVALVANGGAATMLWSTYCPSLQATGLVSTATGYLDFMSYMGAAVANLIFSNAVATIGWGWLILSWAGLMGVGVLVGLKKE